MAQFLPNGVIIGRSSAKWDKSEEFLLNEVITVTNDKLGGIKWNLLFLFLLRFAVFKNLWDYSDCSYDYAYVFDDFNQTQ
jgi:hypothetical protein